MNLRPKSCDEVEVVFFFFVWVLENPKVKVTRKRSSPRKRGETEVTAEMPELKERKLTGSMYMR